MDHPLKKPKPRIYLDHIEDVVSLNGREYHTNNRARQKRLKLNKCAKYPFHNRQLVIDNRGKLTLGGATHISSNGSTIVQSLLGVDDPYSDSKRRRPKHSNLLTPAEKLHLEKVSGGRQPYLIQMSHYYGCIDNLLCEIFDNKTQYSPSRLKEHIVNYRARAMELYFEIDGHFPHMQNAIRRAATRSHGCISSQWRDPKDRDLESIEDKWLLNTDNFKNVSQAVLKVYPKGEHKQVTRIEIQLKFKNIFGMAYCNPLFNPSAIDRTLTLAGTAQQALGDNIKVAENILTIFHASLLQTDALGGDFIKSFLNFSRRVFSGVDGSKKHEAIAQSIYDHSGSVSAKLLKGIKCNGQLREYARIGVLLKSGRRGSTANYTLAPDWKVRFRTELKLRQLRLLAKKNAKQVKRPLFSDWRDLFNPRPYGDYMCKQKPKLSPYVLPMNADHSKIILIRPEQKDSIFLDLTDCNKTTQNTLTLKLS